ncbi:MAG: hypothetical protein QM753_14150 [Thermomicrobiales bacterium]
MHIISIAMLILATILYGLRFFRPFANMLEGDTFLRRPVPLLARMRMHIVPAVVGTLVAGASVRIMNAPSWVSVVPLLTYLLLIALPISYTLTSEGIRLGYGTFRRWTEFAGAIRYRGGAKLQGANGRRGMRIWLGGARGDDEFLLVVRRAIRDAYKGGDATQVVAFSTETPAGDDHSAFHIPA